MYNEELPAGTYRAKANDADVYTSRNGALMLGVLWEITDGEWAGCTITSRDCLISTQGQLMTKKIDMVRDWAHGWDGVNTEWFKANYGSFDVDIVVKREESTYNGVTKIRPEVAFVNDPDSQHGITKGDAKRISAQFGAKLRAYAASKARPATAAKPAQAAKPTGQAKPTPPPAPAQEGDQDQGDDTPPNETPEEKAERLSNEAWDLHCKRTVKMSKDERRDAWFDLVARITPRKDYHDFPAEIWEKVIAEMNNDLPF